MISFNPETDLISLHYDHAPDKDDGHATVAGKVLADTYGFDHVVVGGAHGKNGNRYNPASESVMDATWGVDGWINAHDNRQAAIQELGKAWLATIQNGGQVLVAEGGQADTSLGAAEYVRDNGGDLSKIKIIQHSNWNIQQYSDGVLDALNDLGVEHIKIDDGNQSNDTADLNTTNSSVSSFVSTALDSKWSNAWEAAFEYYNPEIRLDFSDTVEALHILGIGLDEVANITDFADLYFDATLNPGNTNPVPEDDSTTTDDSVDPTEEETINDNPVGAPVTLGLSLVDSDSDTVIGTITDGSTIDLGQVGSEVSLKAEPSKPVSQVKFDLTGATEIVQTENVSPYALAGDISSDYENADFNLGDHTLTVTPYDSNGQAYDSLTTNFTVVDNASGANTNPTVPQDDSSTTEEETINDNPVGTLVAVELSLVDADRDTVIGTITDGSTIDLGQVGSEVSLKAEPSKPVSQVNFELTGATEIVQTENVSPYALAGDISSDYENADFNLGDHTLTVTPYDSNGQAYDSLTTNFTVVDNASGANTNPTVPQDDSSTTEEETINDNPVGTLVAVGLSLVDADRDTVIGTITDGSTIDLGQVGFEVSLKAEPSEPVSQVNFELTGATEINQTENVSPYALAGDISGNYFSAGLIEGDYTLTVTPYDVDGQAYERITTNFSVVDDLG